MSFVSPLNARPDLQTQIWRLKDKVDEIDRKVDIILEKVLDYLDKKEDTE
jgi:hypothetical protein